MATYSTAISRAYRLYVNKLYDFLSEFFQELRVNGG